MTSPLRCAIAGLIAILFFTSTAAADPATVTPGPQDTFDAARAWSIVEEEQALASARSGGNLSWGGICALGIGGIVAVAAWPVTAWVVGGVALAGLGGGAVWLGMRQESQGYRDAIKIRDEHGLGSQYFKDHWFASLSRARQQQVIDDLAAGRIEIDLEQLSYEDSLIYSPRVIVRRLDGWNAGRNDSTAGGITGASPAPGAAGGAAGVTR